MGQVLYANRIKATWKIIACEWAFIILKFSCPKVDLVGVLWPQPSKPLRVLVKASVVLFCCQTQSGTTCKTSVHQAGHYNSHAAQLSVIKRQNVSKHALSKISLPVSHQNLYQCSCWKPVDPVPVVTKLHIILMMTQIPILVGQSSWVMTGWKRGST